MQTLFEKFGGIRPMAEHLNESPSTVQSWKNAGRVPAGKQPQVLRKAAELQLDVDPLDVIFPLGPCTSSSEEQLSHCTRCHEHVSAAEATTCASEHCPMRVALVAEAA